MNYSTYRFTLDIHKTKSQVSIPVLYMDTGIQFLISLTDGGKPYIIEGGCLAVFYGKKADGTTLVTDCKIIDNTRINYTFDDQTTTAEGVASCEIRLYSKEGRLITTPAFDIVVNPRVVNDEDIIPSDSARDALDQLFESEAVRKEAEQDRQEAEEGRASAETARALAESARQEAEETRQKAETTRQEAETARALAESERVQGFEEAKQEVLDLSAELVGKYNTAAHSIKLVKDGKGDYHVADGAINLGHSGVLDGTNLILTEGECEDGNLTLQGGYDYRYALQLADRNGNLIGTPIEIDLPLESVVVDGAYDSATKNLQLTLENGRIISISIADIVGGLASTAYVDESVAALRNDLMSERIEVVQSTGFDSKKVMSQKAVRDAIGFKPGKNLFNKNDPDIILDAMINTAGNISTAEQDKYAADYYVSGYVSVTAGETYAFTKCPAVSACAAFYNENKERISYVSMLSINTAGYKVTIPEGAHYMRFTDRLRYLDLQQVELGTHITPYEPYTETPLPYVNADTIANILERIAALENGSKTTVEGETLIFKSVSGSSVSVYDTNLILS